MKRINFRRKESTNMKNVKDKSNNSMKDTTKVTKVRKRNTNNISKPDKLYVNRLLNFYYVATCKNITHAAKEAGIYQSSMSRQISGLEREIGMSLMSRHADGIVLTRKGEELFEYTKNIFSEVQASRKKLYEEGDVNGVIRISTTYGIANYILAPHLLEFKRLHPEIFFDVICNDEAIDLMKNNVDVAIRPYDADSENIHQVPLFKLQAKLYASKKYIDNYGLPETKEDLKNHKFIAYSHIGNMPSYYPTDWFLQIEGCTTKKNCIMRSNSVEFIYKAVHHGLGIASGHKAMELIQQSDIVNIVPDLHGPDYSTYFIYSEKSSSLNRLEILKKFLIDRFANDNMYL